VVEFRHHSFSEIHSLVSQCVVMSTLISSPQMSHFDSKRISPSFQFSGQILGISSTGWCIREGQVMDLVKKIIVSIFFTNGAL